MSTTASMVEVQICTEERGSPDPCGINIVDTIFQNCSAERGGGYADHTIFDYDINTRQEIVMSNLTIIDCNAIFSGSAIAFVQVCPEGQMTCRSLTTVSGASLPR